MLPYPSGDLHVGHAKNYVLAMRSRAFTACSGRTSCTRWAGTRSAPGRERRDPARDRPREPGRARTSPHAPPGPADGDELRLDARARVVRPRLLPLEPVVLHPHVRARARVQARSTGELVSGRPHRAGQRAGRERPLLALRRGGRTPQPRAVVLQDHRLRRTAAARPRSARRLARPHPHDAAHWIGKSEGVTFSFDVENVEAQIEVFTTRIDTVFGATFVAGRARASGRRADSREAAQARRRVEEFAESLKSKSELERTQLMEKTGVPIGAYAINRSRASGSRSG